ncbi:MAG: NAD-binding protein, partial [Planctomycetota bacterium]
AAVGISTAGLKLSWPEKALLCLVAPRGIVAAAVASVFTLALANAERFEDPDRLVALTFFVIVGTVSFYGIAAPLVANWLGVSDQDPQGVLFVGAGAGSRVFAESLHKRGHRVLLVDTNREHVIAARMLGLDARFGNVLEEPFLEGLDLRGIGRVVAATPNEEVNALALQRFTRLFGRAATYAISRKPIDDANLPEAQRAARPETHARGETPGRVLLEGSTTLEDLREKKRLGWIEHAVRLGPDLGWPAYQTLYGGASILLYVIEKSGRVQLATADRKNTKPRAGDTIVALVDPDSLLMGPLFEEGQPEGEADPAGGR